MTGGGGKFKTDVNVLPPLQPLLRESRLDSDQIETILDVLSHRVRWYMLSFLWRKGQTSLADLAVQMAAWKENCRRSELSDTMCERTAIALHHWHLPLLAANTNVRYNHETRVATYTDPHPVIESIVARSVNGTLESA